MNLGLLCRLSVFLLLLVLAGCATRPYEANDLASAGFLQRTLVQEQDGLVISVAVPTAEETLALTGIDLYAQGIQPVWLQVENRSESRARFTTWSIDRDYFAPIEVAYMNRKRFSKQGYEGMQRWFHDNAMVRKIPPGESRSGLVFTQERPGSKGLNLTVIHRQTAQDFTFFVPMPGFVADFMQVDFANLYPPELQRDLTILQLRDVLEDELPCCSRDSTGEKSGGPFNAVLVGTGQAVRRAMLRGGWLETSTDASVAARAREQLYEGRRSDAIFWQRRHDGGEHVVLQLWLTPWQVQGEPAWVGIVYYYLDDDSPLSWFDAEIGRGSDLFKHFTRESPLADIDSAQRFLYQNLWYNGSLQKIGLVRGVGKSSIDAPQTSFSGSTYFTAGFRMVAFLSEDLSALDEVVFLTDPSEFFPGGEPGDLFQGRQVPPPNDRLHIQRSGTLKVATAVPSRDEARAIFDVDLYKENIQPVWVQVENTGSSPLNLTPMGIDKAYFTPREAAHRSRKNSLEPRAEQYEKRGHASLAVPPHSIQSGYIFSRVDEGTKSFNVDVVGQTEAHLMSFFVPVPGLKIDHYELDAQQLYDDSELRDVSTEELVAELESMPCCVRNATGDEKGDPLNLVIIGQPKDLYYAFMRAGWDETETIYGASLWKTAMSAISGGRYRYSPVSALYVFERPQDAAMQRARGSIHERNHLRVWMTPLLHEGVPVWIGQISRDIGVRFTRKTITTHKIDPDVDETREFLLEDLGFNQSLKAIGYVGGVGAAPYEQPRGNLTGDPYFTDGERLVMWLSREPVGLDELQFIDLSPYRTGAIGP